MRGFQVAVACVACLVAAVVSLSAVGQSIQFDFGTTTGAYTGAIAPGYEAGYKENNLVGTEIFNREGLGLLQSKDGTYWNALNTGGTNITGLKYVDGTSATDVTVRIAAGWVTPLYPGGGMYGWTYGVHSWGTSVSKPASVDGVQSTPLMQDYLYTDNSGASASLFGFTISGLPAGDYMVILLGATPTAENNRPYSLAVGQYSGATPPELYTDSRLTEIGMLGTSAGGTNKLDWVSGQNYLMHPITLGADESIVVMAKGDRAGLNGIQIIRVPEPATMSLLALGGLAMLRRRK